MRVGFRRSLRALAIAAAVGGGFTPVWLLTVGDESLRAVASPGSTSTAVVVNANLPQPHPRISGHCGQHPAQAPRDHARGCLIEQVHRRQQLAAQPA